MFAKFRSSILLPFVGFKLAKLAEILEMKNPTKAKLLYGILCQNILNLAKFVY